MGASHPASAHRQGERVGAEHGVHAVSFFDPVNLLGTTRLGAQGGGSSFQQGRGGGGDGEGGTGLHQVAHQRLLSLLVFKFHFDPVGRAGHLRQASLVHFTDKMVVTIPATQAHDRRRRDVHGSRAGSIELAVDVNAARPRTVGIHDIVPLGCR